MKKKNMLIILVFLLTVGFASVSTTLVMNGTIGVVEKTSDFNVIFKSAIVTGNDSAKATISDNKKTIIFETDKLSVVGDTAELVYKVKNDSTQYDANVIVSCTGGNPGYTTIVSEFAGKSLPLTTPELMEAQEVRMGKISVNLTKAYDAGVTKTPLTCTLEIEGEGRESIVEHSVCEYPDGTEWTFDYTGNEQGFIVPCKGEYKLETWGAQGGNSLGLVNGGYGGYSSGNVFLIEDEGLYINVGGQGVEPTSRTCNVPGGYNGGGNGQSCEGSFSIDSVRASGGGGATHIATTSGLLSTLSSSLNQLLIVSGGGGGADYSHFADSNYYHSDGGSGGGYIGVSSSQGTSTYEVIPVPGGTQNLVTSITGGEATYGGGARPGTFGQGGSNAYATGAGGGGGFYGGGAGKNWSGGGGSGYIGNEKLSNKVMYCYNCATSNDEATKTISTTNVSSTPISNYAKSGNGYARIALIKAN